MSEVEKLRALLAEARALLLEARPTNERCDCTQCKPIDMINARIDAALAEPVEGSMAVRLQRVRDALLAAVPPDGTIGNADDVSRVTWLVKERDEARAEVVRLRGEAAAWREHSEAAERFRKSAVAEAEAEVAYWKGEFTRLHAEHLPIAFAGAYQRGAEAMREEIAIRVDGEGINVGSHFGCIIRALPIPEDEP